MNGCFLLKNRKYRIVSPLLIPACRYLICIIKMEKHSLEWTFEPGGILELKKDLKFEKKDPTGKDLYLSAFIVWVYK